MSVQCQPLADSVDQEVKPDLGEALIEAIMLGQPSRKRLSLNPQTGTDCICAVFVAHTGSGHEDEIVRIEK